jgi:hypothetical protein
MLLKTNDEILQMANHLLENDENLRRALEIFQMGQSEYLRALASTHTVQIFSDDKAFEEASDMGEENEKLD